MSEAPASALGAGLSAARANLWPGVALSVFAVLVLLGYEFWPAMHESLQRLAAWRGEQPLWVAMGFAALTTTLAGAVAPGLVQALRPGAPRETLAGFAWLLAFWAVCGLQVELLYRGLDALVGPGRGPLPVATKVFLDMGVYCPLFSLPETVLVYGIKRHGLSWRRYRRAAFGGPGVGSGVGSGVGTAVFAWYRREVFPVLVSAWAIWVPAVCVIYLLPLPLQLPMQNIVLCFWCLMLAVLGPAEPQASPTTP